MTALERARALRQRGLSVFPIPLYTKVPTLPWKAYQDRLATEDELLAWFSEKHGRVWGSNIGVVTGAISGVVVVDADTHAAVRHCVRRLPYTPWQTGTAHGFHLWFAHPGIPTPNRGTDLVTTGGPLPIHIRGDGGFVVAPGSLHPSGAEYREAGDWTVPRTALPRFWRNWLQPPTRPKTTGFNSNPQSNSRDGLLLERARRYLAAIPRPEIGHGSDTAVLSAACRLVRGFHLSPAESEALLWEWCGQRDGWTRDWVATKVANAERYGSEARGGLR
jgi:hypothetical protein